MMSVKNLLKINHALQKEILEEMYAEVGLSEVFSAKRQSLNIVLHKTLQKTKYFGDRLWTSKDVDDFIERIAHKFYGAKQTELIFFTNYPDVIKGNLKNARKLAREWFFSNGFYTYE